MDERVQVKIKPLHNIGGVGKAGDVVWMTPAEAEGYARDGYVELLAEGTSSASGIPLSAATRARGQREEVVEDHAVMKPEAKRATRVVRKK